MPGALLQVLRSLFFLRDISQNANFKKVAYFLFYGGKINFLLKVKNKNLPTLNLDFSFKAFFYTKISLFE